MTELYKTIVTMPEDYKADDLYLYDEKTELWNQYVRKSGNDFILTGNTFLAISPMEFEKLTKEEVSVMVYDPMTVRFLFLKEKK